MKPLSVHVNQLCRRFHCCPRAHRPRDIKRKLAWLFWLYPVIGLVSTVWFLARVIPKPSRAAYPCQRLAAPLGCGFVLWIAGIVATTLAFRKTRTMFRQSRLVLAGVCMALTAVLGIVALATMPERFVLASPPDPNNPIGVAKGVNPGRVVWVHDPDATDWAGVGDGHWWESSHTDQAVVDQMMSRALRRLSGEASDADAWDILIRRFNQTHGKGDVGYQAGEKIMIKVNLVGCIDVPIWGGVDPATYDLVSKMDYMNTAPQMMLALLRQLVYEAGVNESDITIGDPTCLFPNQYYDPLHSEFPTVRYLDTRGLFGRTAIQTSTVPIYWSSHPAGVNQDYLLVSYAEAEYFIDMANLKSHSAAGVTLCTKNHYGSIRRPDVAGYFNLHDTLVDPMNVPGMGHYRAMVDLLGHAHTGGKAVLYLIDGLYSGVHPDDSAPITWSHAPFNGDWTSSVFASQDPVAIDSVGADFLWDEDDPRQYPRMSGADDYLNEAALADNPPSGTFYDPDNAGDVSRLASLGVHEHWNNSTDKQYSRNLGTGNGIELVQVLDSQDIIETLNVRPTTTALTIDGIPDDWDLGEFTDYSRGGEQEIGDIGQVGWLSGTMYYGNLCPEPGFTLPTDATDHTVRFYSRHDANYQYFLIRSDDDDIQCPYEVEENWRNDCAEFFIDPGHYGDATPMWDYETTSEFQLVVDACNQVNVYMTTAAYRTQILSGITSAVAVDGSGWWLELRIAKTISNPPLPPGGLFGLNMHFRDQDTSDQALYGWALDYAGSGGFPDKIPANWGDVYNPYAAAGGATVTVETLNSKVGTITIDGDTSDWNLVDFVTQVRGGENTTTGDIAVIGFDGGSGPYYSGSWPGGVLPTSAADHSVKIYARHDDTYQYFLVEVLDSDVQTLNAVALNWANDCVEFYIDPGHDGGATGLSNSTSDIQLVIDAANQKNVYQCDSGYAATVLGGVTSALVSVTGGWGVEVRIAKNVLDPDIPSSSGDYGLDFNLRDNDNDNDVGLTTVYTWADDTEPAGFPSKIPDNWGTCMLESAPVNEPPIVDEVSPDPDPIAQGVEYTEQLTLAQGTLPIVWYKVQGPANLSVDQDGYVSGWTPESGDVGQTFAVEIAASNGFGADTEAWQVEVTAETVAVETLNVKPAGTIIVDGATSDWNLSAFTTTVRGGEDTVRGDIALVGWDGGDLYYGSYWTGAGLPNNEADHTARVYARDDATYQYFLVILTDDDIRTPSPTETNWQNDCVEFYIDPSHDGGGSSLSNSVSDIQLVIDAANQPNVYMCTPGYAAQVLGGVTSAINSNTSGWTLEVRILKTALDPDMVPLLGTYGLNFAFRDNDGDLADPVSTMYTWTNDNTQVGGFPNKIPDNWGDAVAAPADACVDDGDCDNGDWCDGAETCDTNGICQTGTPPDCGDGVGCTVDFCDELGDQCVNIASNGLCDNGSWCDGVETCDDVLDCQAGTAPDCTDTVSCTVDSCDEVNDVCMNVPEDTLCSNGLFCDGAETCDAVLDCQPGTYPCTDPQVPYCDEDLDECFAGCNAVLYAEDFNSNAPADDPLDWIDTGANNSLAENDALFKVFDVGGELVFGTTSTSTNIHSHYGGPGGDTWSSYRVTGKMMMTNSAGGIGVTFLSSYPNADEYYRLRRGNFPGGVAFHLDRHPDDQPTLVGTTDTGVVPTANEWYRFKIEVDNSGPQNSIRANVWLDGTQEPAGWQADCIDTSGLAATEGTIGLWSMSLGNKYGDDLQVATLSNDCSDGDPCTVETCSNGSCLYDPVDCSAFNDTCNEASCDSVGTNGNCDIMTPINIGGSCTDGDYCNGEETCDALGVCQAGPEPCLATEWCHESTDACIEYGLGDSEPDGDVDLADFRVFQTCFGELGLNECQASNLTGEGVIDLDDYEEFAAVLDGPY